METAGYLVPVGLVFFLAGTVKGVIGLGLPTVAMGLLAIRMPPAQAAALLLVPSLVTNVWQLFSGPRCAALLRRLWPMLLAVCLGVWAGPNLMAGEFAGWASLLLGVMLMAYAFTGLRKGRGQIGHRAERWLGPVAGLTTGVVTGATGVFVIPAVPYLNALGLERDELIQALGLSFTVSTLALAANLARHDLLSESTLGMSLMAIAPALAGMLFGGWLRGKISAPLFRRCFFLGLLGLGVEITYRHLPPV